MCILKCVLKVCTYLSVLFNNLYGVFFEIVCVISVYICQYNNYCIVAYACLLQDNNTFCQDMGLCISVPVTVAKVRMYGCICVHVCRPVLAWCGPSAPHSTQSCTHMVCS